VAHRLVFEGGDDAGDDEVFQNVARELVYARVEGECFLTTLPAKISLIFKFIVPSSG
jgi:hypothetical protein